MSSSIRTPEAWNFLSTYARRDGEWQPSKVWGKVNGQWLSMGGTVATISVNHDRFKTIDVWEILKSRGEEDSRIIVVEIGLDVVVTPEPEAYRLTPEKEEKYGCAIYAVGDWLPNQILVIKNRGYLFGKGGDAGRGGIPMLRPPSDGEDGHPAIITNIPTQVESEQGLICGGGGGGGAAGTIPPDAGRYYASKTPKYKYTGERHQGYQAKGYSHLIASCYGSYAYSIRHGNWAGVISNSDEENSLYGSGEWGYSQGNMSGHITKYPSLLSEEQRGGYMGGLSLGMSAGGGGGTPNGRYAVRAVPNTVNPTGIPVSQATHYGDFDTKTNSGSNQAGKSDISALSAPLQRVILYSPYRVFGPYNSNAKSSAVGDMYDDYTNLSLSATKGSQSASGKTLQYAFMDDDTGDVNEETFATQLDPENTVSTGQRVVKPNPRHHFLGTTGGFGYDFAKIVRESFKPLLRPDNAADINVTKFSSLVGTTHRFVHQGYYYKPPGLEIQDVSDSGLDAMKLQRGSPGFASGNNYNFSPGLGYSYTPYSANLGVVAGSVPKPRSLPYDYERSHLIKRTLRSERTPTIGRITKGDTCYFDALHLAIHSPTWGMPGMNQCLGMYLPFNNDELLDWDVYTAKKGEVSQSADGYERFYHNGFAQSSKITKASEAIFWWAKCGGVESSGTIMPRLHALEEKSYGTGSNIYYYKRPVTELTPPMLTGIHPSHSYYKQKNNPQLRDAQEAPIQKNFEEYMVVDSAGEKIEKALFRIMSAQGSGGYGGAPGQDGQDGTDGWSFFTPHRKFFGGSKGGKAGPAIKGAQYIMSIKTNAHDPTWNGLYGGTINI